MIATVPTERSFGISVGGVCLALGGLTWWRNQPVAATTLVAVGSVLVVAGLVAPSALRIPNRIWWRFAQALGWFNSRVLLTVFFYLVITPVGVVMRISGRDPLRSSATGTGWSPYASRRNGASHYEHLF